MNSNVRHPNLHLGLGGTTHPFDDFRVDLTATEGIEHPRATNAQIWREELIPHRPRFRDDHRRHRLGVLETGEFSCQKNGTIQAAEFIHQADLNRVATTPHPTLGDSSTTSIGRSRPWATCSVNEP